MTNMKQFHRWSSAAVVLALILVGTHVVHSPGEEQDTQENVGNNKEDTIEDLESEEHYDSFENKDFNGFGKLGEVELIEEYDNVTTEQPPDLSNEEWVKDAVLDVAYYLRSHKFNDFDRRYYNESLGKKASQYHQFPRPPLRYLHWEVYRYCDKGFYDCLAYLSSIAGDAVLTRSSDSCKIINEKNWEYPRNAGSIESVEKECIRRRDIDWKDADPFKGPLERFQWRVSASYYMCHFTMLEYAPLIMFGERCDNYANCLMGRSARNYDPRADDSLPFQCAMYSFCPDVCCHKRVISNTEECWGLEDNPCGWNTDTSKRQCGFKRASNKELVSVILNEWNVTCHCDPGYVWESMFGFCVDTNECSTGTHTCTPTIQTCLNLKGSYKCICAWGYINVTGTCVPNDILTTALLDLHTLYHKPEVVSPKPFSFIRYFSDLVKNMLSANNTVEVTTELPSTTTGLPQIDFDELLPQ